MSALSLWHKMTFLHTSSHIFHLEKKRDKECLNPGAPNKSHEVHLDRIILDHCWLLNQLTQPGEKNVLITLKSQLPNLRLQGLKSDLPDSMIVVSRPPPPMPRTVRGKGK